MKRLADAADYLCVELDFMKQLCLREETLRLEEGESWGNYRQNHYTDH